MKFQKILTETMNFMKTEITHFDIENRELYAEWMAQTYFFVRHSAKMIALSMAHSKNQKSERQALQHLREEAGHDLLLLKDLKSLNVKIEDFTELSSTKAFWQCQYYWISHVHPESYLGYALFLEALAAEFGNIVFERVQKVHNVDNGFLKLHYEEDQDHSSNGVAFVESLPEELQNVIIENFLESFHLYQQILKECESKHSRKVHTFKKAS